MEVTSNIIERIASVIVESLNLEPGEAVYIIGGVHTHQLIETVALEVYKAGGVPQFTSVSDSYLQQLYTKVPANHLQQSPKHTAALVENMDAYVLIDYPKNPALLAHVDGERVSAHRKAGISIRESIFDPETGKKWCYVAWPTKEASEYYGVDFTDLRDMVIGGILAPQKDVITRCQHVAELLSGGAEVHVEDGCGTDFTVTISGRRIHIEDGIISQYDLQTQDRGNNLPCGEVCVAPHETEGEGIVYSPLVSDSLSNILLKDVILRFKKGQLILDQCDAAENCDVMIRSFHHYMNMDREQYGDIKTLNVAELGIGLNPTITKHIGYILTDEKINGTAHLAFGMSDALGGTSKSSLHWDFVTAKGATIEVTKEDGSCHTIMKKGIVRW